MHETLLARDDRVLMTNINHWPYARGFFDDNLTPYPGNTNCPGMEVAGLDCDGRTCRFGARLVYFCARERRQKLPGHAQTPEFRYAGEFRRVANGRGGRGSRDWWNAQYLEIDLRPLYGVRDCA
jgi:hypothetical protein